MEPEKRECKNCSHFLQHYASVTHFYYPVMCGHCLKRVLTPKERRSFPFSTACEDWEPIEIRKEARKKSVKEVLENISHRLDDIASMFENEFM